MFIKHTSKKIYMHASNEYPGPLPFALWLMINQQIPRYMIFGYVTQSWAFPVLFRISVLPSQDPMVFSACMGNQQHLVHWNRSLLHCGFYQLQLLPGISLQLRKIWQPNSGHFGHVWMSFQMIQDDSQEDSQAHPTKYSTSEYFSQSEDIKVWLCGLRCHQLWHIHSNLVTVRMPKLRISMEGNVKGLPPWNFT